MQKSLSEMSAIVADTVTGLGYEFVEFERLARGLIRVTIDSANEGGIGVDDCERVSDQLTRLFTVEAIDFERLEVSSPGVDRPLKRLVDWVRFVGREAHVELFEPLHGPELPQAGRRKFDGHILSATEEAIEFSIEEIQHARTPSEAARAKKKSRARKPALTEKIVVRFAFSDVDRANLIAQLDFKGNKR